jgi:hypothetical protein
VDHERPARGNRRFAVHLATRPEGPSQRRAPEASGRTAKPR